MNIANDMDLNLPPNFEIYSKNQREEKYDIMLPDRLGMCNPSTNPSFVSKPIDFTALRMQRIEKRSLNVPDEDEFNNVEIELNRRKKEAEIISKRYEQLTREKEDLIHNSYNQRYTAF
jgi:hypothetical protein